MWMERTDPSLSPSGDGVKARTVKGIKPKSCSLALFDLAGKRVSTDAQLLPTATSPHILFAIESVRCQTAVALGAEAAAAEASAAGAATAVRTGEEHTEQHCTGKSSRFTTEHTVAMW